MVKKGELKKILDDLSEWFRTNPKLPEDINRLHLQRFLKCMDYNVEETKKLIELNYTLRNKSPQIFIDRSPDYESAYKTWQAADFIPLPGLTPKGHKLLFYRLVDPDPKKLNPVEETRIFFMMADCRFITTDVEQADVDTANCSETNDNNNCDDNIEEEDEDEDDKDDTLLASGDVQVVDISGYSMGHVARVSFSHFRTYMKYLQEAYPVRLREMHMINCPSFLNKLIAIFKPFIHEDVFKLVHFHTEGLESFYEHVPQDMLPEEYGGKAGKLADLKKAWWDTMQDKKDYLTDPKYWKVEQSEKTSRWFFF